MYNELKFSPLLTYFISSTNNLLCLCSFVGQQVTRLSPLSGATNALPSFQQQQQLSPRVNQVTISARFENLVLIIWFSGYAATTTAAAVDGAGQRRQPAERATAAESNAQCSANGKNFHISYF
jgi:hypothetical protein